MLDKKLNLVQKELMDALNDLQIETGKLETVEKKLTTKEDRISKLEKSNDISKGKQQGMFNQI